MRKNEKVHGLTRLLDRLELAEARVAELEKHVAVGDAIRASQLAMLGILRQRLAEALARKAETNGS